MSQIIGSTLIRIDSTGSTNNYATRQVAESEVEEGTVFLAQAQTAGKGQLNNRWESEAGKNLTFSIFAKPSFLNIRRQFMLSKVVCLGLEVFLSNYIDDVTIKWPNDIYVGTRKICGILIENSIMNWQISQSVIGIGLNINQTVFVSDAPNPVSLSQLTSKEYDLDKMISDLLLQIDHFYQKLKTGEYDDIDNAFLNKLYRLDEWCIYKDDNHQYSGKIIGVNEIGQLKIQEKDGVIHEYHFKEVEFL